MVRLKLEYVKLVQQNWVLEFQSHNGSIKTYYKDGEL